MNPAAPSPGLSLFSSGLVSRAVGLFLLSVATLTLELLQVRLFGVTMWYHMATLVIGVALLGLGAAGTLMAVWPRLREADGDTAAAWAAFGFAASTVPVFAGLARIPLDTYMDARTAQVALVALDYLLIGIPFVFAGVALAMPFAKAPERSPGLYLANLLGSGLGCLLPLALLTPLGGEVGVMVAAALGALAAAVFAWERVRGLALGSVALAVVLLALIPWAPTILHLKPAATKALGLFQTEMDKCVKEHGKAACGGGEMITEYRRWDPIARIDGVNYPLGPLLPHWFEAPHRILTIDGDAYTYAYRFAEAPHTTPDWPRIQRLRDSLYAVGYWPHGEPLERVLAIGLGGGIDVMTALAHEARHIDAVEINAAMLDAVRVHYKDWTGDPYGAPQVTTHHAEGRAFVRHANDLYDHIQLSGVDTWTGLASGAYVLSENYLYTVEAFEDYLDRLKPGGTVALMRWLMHPPREMLRLCTVASEALRRRGVKEPGLHIALVRESWFATIIVKPTPFSRREIERLKTRVAEATFKGQHTAEILYAPGVEPRDYIFLSTPDRPAEKTPNQFVRYFAAQRLGPEIEKRFLDTYPFELWPVTDDNPFFFMDWRWSHLFQAVYTTGGSMETRLPVALLVLAAALIQGLLFSLAAILLPLRAYRHEGLAVPGVGRAATYFAALGLGFMFVEIGLMQKLVLFVGHPTHSLAVTLAGLLVWAGVGAYSADRLPWSLKKRAGLATLAAATLGVAYAWGLDAVLAPWMGLPTAARMAITIILLAPLGLVLGVPFPTGLQALSGSRAVFVPWAWGINGCASVVASAAAILVALETGFAWSVTIGAGLYLLATWAFVTGSWVGESPSPAPTVESGGAEATPDGTPEPAVAS